MHKLIFLPALILGALAAPGLAIAQTAPAATQAPATATAPAASSPQAARPANDPLRSPNRFAGRAGQYYRLVWGVDDMNIKLVESGEVIRFTWRVVDSERSKALADKANTPSLEDPQAGVSLVVPQVENIGMLRQTQTPEVGRAYWMAFSNHGHMVKRGDRVNVVIGQFRANGLVVD
jgi:hypothetical protein